MKITKDAAVAICVGVGFSNAPHWSKERLMSRILDFSKSSAYVDLQVNREVVEDDDEAERLDDLLEKLREANGDVQPSGTPSVSSEKEKPVEDKPEADAVVDDDEPVAEDDDAFDDAFSDDGDDEEEIPPAVEVAPDPKDVSVIVKPPQKPKPIVPGRDRFNSKIGTKANLVNEALTEEFQTPKEISIVASVVVSQVYSQTKKLQQKGYVIIGEDKRIKLSPEMYLEPVPEPIEMTGEDSEQEVDIASEPEWDEDSPTEKPVKVEKQSEAAPSKPQKPSASEQPWSGDCGTTSSSSSKSSPCASNPYSLDKLREITQFVIDAATEFKELLNRY